VHLCGDAMPLATADSSVEVETVAR
jgi:hypothetical protein